MSDTAIDFVIGSANPGTVRYMNGMLDEVAIYSAPLTDDAIFNHWTYGLSGKTMNQLKLRADVLSDTAWVEGYTVYPRYG